MQKNLVIQALRGIAALAVVVFHCSALLGPTSLETRGAVFGPLAFGGVDLFFLISGYIIASSVSRMKPGVSSASSFLLKRLIRVWPPYAIATAIFCVAFSLTNPSAPSFADITRSLLFIQLDGTAPYYGYAALIVGWTLNYEMLFYGVVTLGLLTRYRWLVIFLIFPFILVGVPVWQNPELTFIQLLDAERTIGNEWVITNPLNWLFLLGVVIYFIEKRKLTVNNVWGFVLSASLASAFLGVCYFLPVMNKHGLTGMGLAVLPIFAVFVLSKDVIERHVSRALVYMGDISFSLYLTHVITLSVTNAALSRFTDKGILLMFLAVCASIVGGAVYYAFVERPITRWLSSRSVGISNTNMAIVK